MIISIDYDDTWTADPQMWGRIVKMMRARGHTVIGVTNRPPFPQFMRGVKKDMGPYVEDIIFAGPGPKREAAARMGYNVDVWIDDYPSAVDYGRR